MKLFNTTLNGRIYFRLRETNEIKFYLESFPGVFIVNPLIYSKISKTIETNFFSSNENNLILTTNGLIWGTEKTDFDLSEFPIDDFHKLPENQRNITTAIMMFATKFISAMRIVSRQVSIPTSITSAYMEEFEEGLPSINYPIINNKFESFLDNFIWQTSVIWEQLVETDKNTINPKFPIYEKLIVDAIQAIKTDDFKRALLYSAIAMETIATTKLDSVFESKLTNLDSSLRLINITVNKSKKVVKDPIYSFIRAKCKFNELLHELSLYLTGKSLRIENPKLFEKASKLYRTRNKIAHLGEPIDNEGKNDIFQECYQDSVLAIQICQELLNWFGETNNFPIIRFGFVKTYPVTINE